MRCLFSFPLALALQSQRAIHSDTIQPAAVAKTLAHLLPSKPPSATCTKQSTKPNSQACQREILLHQDFLTHWHPGNWYRESDSTGGAGMRREEGECMNKIEQLTEKERGWINHMALGWLVLCIDGWTDSITVGWMDGWNGTGMNGQIDRPVPGWMDG